MNDFIRVAAIRINDRVMLETAEHYKTKGYSVGSVNIEAIIRDALVDCCGDQTSTAIDLTRARRVIERALGILEEAGGGEP